MALQGRCKLIERSSGKENDVESHEILTPSQLAGRLQLPVSWIYRHVERGCSNPLPCLRCGHYLRFSWPDVEAWLRDKQSAEQQSC